MLNVMPDADSLGEVVEEYKELEQMCGVPFKVLSLEETLAKEPSLRGMANIAGSIFTPKDSGGDALLFTSGLEEVCRKNGVEFRYNVAVRDVVMEKGTNCVESIILTDGSKINAHNYVVAAGSYTPSFFSNHGLYANLPILPMKGHSLTVKLPDDRLYATDSFPQYLMILTGSFTSLNRFGNTLRLTNGSDFFGLDRTQDLNKVSAMKGLIQAALPALKQYDPKIVSECKVWTGLRPMTPDGLPIIGLLPGFGNVFVSSGGGTLGWSMAASSGKLVADEVTLNYGEKDREVLGISTEPTDSLVPEGKKLVHGLFRPSRFYSPLSRFSSWVQNFFN